MPGRFPSGTLRDPEVLLERESTGDDAQRPEQLLSHLAQ